MKDYNQIASEAAVKIVNEGSARSEELGFITEVIQTVIKKATEELRKDLFATRQAALSEGIRADRARERDWTEDFTHENGRYLSTCMFCHETFTGHKRRVCCKVCANKPAHASESRKPTDEEIYDYLYRSGRSEPATEAAQRQVLSRRAAHASETNLAGLIRIVKNEIDNCDHPECEAERKEHGYSSCAGGHIARRVVAAMSQPPFRKAAHASEPPKCPHCGKIARTDTEGPTIMWLCCGKSTTR